jgi:histidine triad (HIT) family protein
MDCIFCKIIAKEVPAAVVYEDDLVFAFLDMHPVREGHTLVIPKSHVPEFQNIESAAYAAVMTTAQKIAKALRATTDAARIGLAVVGFDVPHAHVHVIPLHDADDISSKRKLDGQLGNPTLDERRATAEKIRKAF